MAEGSESRLVIGDRGHQSGSTMTCKTLIRRFKSARRLLDADEPWFPGLFLGLAITTRPNSTESNEGPFHRCLLGTAGTPGLLYRLSARLTGKMAPNLA